VRKIDYIKERYSGLRERKYSIEDAVWRISYEENIPVNVVKRIVGVK